MCYQFVSFVDRKLIACACTFKQSNDNRNKKIMLEIILGIIAALLLLRFFVKEKPTPNTGSATEEPFTLVENDTVILLQTETIDDMIYCFSAVDDQFICQGKSLNELRSHFSIRFPSHNGVIAKFDARAKQILLDEKM